MNGTGTEAGGGAVGGPSTGGGLGVAGSSATSGAPTGAQGGSVSAAGGGAATGGGGPSLAGGGGTAGGPTGGAAMSGNPDVNAVVPSAGCGKPPFSAAGSWAKQPSFQIDGRERKWHVRFPDNYEPNRAYPIVFKFHGCGDKDNNIPIERVSGADAITVRGESVGQCWDDLAPVPEGSHTAADGRIIDDNTESFDLPFVDAMLDHMKKNACVDEHRVFGIGFSSGGWTTTILACKRANVFRGLGSSAGADWVHANKLDAPQCAAGKVARIYISGTNDTGSNSWANHVSAEERLVANNGCTAGSAMPVEPSPCQRFQGCGDYPIEHCLLPGHGHDREDNLAPGLFWDFFSKVLPKP